MRRLESWLPFLGAGLILAGLVVGSFGGESYENPGIGAWLLFAGFNVLAIDLIVSMVSSWRSRGESDKARHS